MPLLKGSSQAIVNENIKSLMREGKSHAQAIAIALSESRQGQTEPSGKERLASEASRLRRERTGDREKIDHDIELPNESGISDITKDTGNSSTGPLPPLHYRTTPFKIKGGDYLPNRHENDGAIYPVRNTKKSKDDDHDEE